MIGTLATLAQALGARLAGDRDFAVERVDTVEEARSSSLTFAVDERYLKAAMESNAGAVLTSVTDADVRYPGRNLLIVADARGALAALLARLEPPRPAGPFVHPSAVVEPTARIGERVWIGASCVVGAEAEVGDDTVLAAGAQVGARARLGRRCTLHPRALLLDGCVAGDEVVLQAGAVVGSDGFGYAFVDGRYVKIPQVGNVVLGDRVEIGANACVDRAQTGSTVIGEGSKIDNLVQIGHNCELGRNVGIAALTGLAGTTIVGDYVRMGGQVGTKGHVRIGDRVALVGRSGVWKDITEPGIYGGSPAVDHRVELKRQGLLRQLPKLLDRIRALERTSSSAPAGQPGAEEDE
ncbi:MAG TPA: UDP-3-O-(3-hydroxymyristoyl)glucosamine N-acyltransferase [Candidatus Dormibacteraeota bacterium]|nr:UDP-3-O-(3-hydroxymyristoyl)glucosamine N-acyltransferase [Candidatus Dormibacteraeota bacterium]